MEKGKFPCIKCTKEIYEKVLRNKLLELGYIDRTADKCHIDDNWNTWPILTTGYNTNYNKIGNFDRIFSHQYLCEDVDTFLHDARELAIREGWYKPSKQQLLDIRYMKMACIWATNSYCTRRQVGALIVKDKMIISDGYNGTPTGFPNVCENKEGNTFSYVLHAEANAITKVAKSTNNCDGATIYVTTSPCIECAKLIIQSGIKRVVYKDEYRDIKGIELLKQAKIIVEQIEI